MIVALYTGLLGLLLVGLSFYVINWRRKASIGVGFLGSEELERAVRAHGNFTEYVPLALVIIGLYEMSGGAIWSIHALGSTLLVARLLHAYGLSRSAGTSAGRLLGTILTFGVILFGSVMLIAPFL